MDAIGIIKQNIHSILELSIDCSEHEHTYAKKVTDDILDFFLTAYIENLNWGYLMDIYDRIIIAEIQEMMRNHFTGCSEAAYDVADDFSQDTLKKFINEYYNYLGKW